ncbi:hypothetical protein FB451DRAFT_1361372 [Mycena latifolia]|nr:hypothetical protein FB451DRAFT_1361372 [Mycena latifolia]
MQDTAQLTVSILLWLMSFIPHTVLRYTLLAITTCLALLCTIRLKRPSTQLSHLEHIVQKTEGTILDAKSHCARDHANLLEKWAELLKVKRSASKIQSRMLETNTTTWTEYRLLSDDISDCAKSVKEIRTAVQLIVEAERQRKYTEDINKTEAILTSVRSPRTCLLIDTVFPMRIKFSLHVFSLPVVILVVIPTSARIDGAYGMMEMSNLNSILYSTEAVIHSLDQFDTSIGPPNRRDKMRNFDKPTGNL